MQIPSVAPAPPVARDPETARPRPRLLPDVEEVWRPVVGWEGVYSASDQGRIRRDLRTGGAQGNGYVLADSVGPGFGSSWYVNLIHRPRKSVRPRIQELVWQAFVGPIPAGHRIGHRDGNKRRNALANLVLRTEAEQKRYDSATMLMRRLQLLQTKLRKDNQRLSREDWLTVVVETLF